MALLVKVKTDSGMEEVGRGVAGWAEFGEEMTGLLESPAVVETRGQEVERLHVTYCSTIGL